MSEVLTGKGPQPPQVYWLRRGIVALLAIVVVGLLVWAFIPKGGPTAGVPQNTESPAPSPTASSATTAPSASPSGTSTSSSVPSASPATTAPTACEPIGVQLTVAGFKSIKTTGKQVFSVTAENNTAEPCVMEITPETFRLRVTSGADLIWSTAHCDKWLPEVKKQTLAAGKSVEFKANWTATRSAEGCKLAKAKLRAGTYVAQATYAENAYGRFTFTLAE